ncbi:hypothetical protein J4219_08210 [Candidatus Woesearchaeota archaeon]|nr:hypothetical protein [Candidatus Woesearchaeota archaeon]
MDIQLFIKEGTSYKVLRVPVYVVKNLLRDRLSRSELDRIHRLAGPVEMSDNFKSGSIIVDFSSKTAECYQTKIDLTSFDPTWKVNNEKITLNNY